MSFSFLSKNISQFLKQNVLNKKRSCPHDPCLVFPKSPKLARELCSFVIEHLEGTAELREA